jgi:hypothetical protein
VYVAKLTEGTEFDPVRKTSFRVPARFGEYDWLQKRILNCPTYINSARKIGIPPTDIGASQISRIGMSEFPAVT